MAEQEQWRVFCAIDLPHDIREMVMSHSMRLRKAVPEAQASWSRPDNIHLTLKFLGEVPKSRVEALSRAAANASTGHESFPIRVQGTGAFPTHREPLVLWIGIEDLKGKLGELYGRLEDECVKAGFKKEVRPFHPHLTVARLRKPQRARTLAAAHKAMGFEPAEIAVSELLVITSELSSEGSRYTVISRHPLERFQ
jgi:RNA 2',3'-cyclic 3'-phosphodiesterase